MNSYANLQYQKTQTITADRRRLIVLLYEAAIKFLRKAQGSIGKKNIEKRHYYLLRAINIIDELNNSLDLSKGGEIAQSLRSLYLFMRRHLVAAEIKNDSKMIQEVINMLSSLNEAWEKVASDPELNNTDQDARSSAGGIRI